MAEELHYPPGTPEAQAAAEAAAKAEAEASAKSLEEEAAAAEAAEKAQAEEAAKAEADAKAKEEAEKGKLDDPEVPLKKRSIYDDLKDTRKEKNAFKDAAVAALEAQGVTLTGKETAEELQALAKKTPSDAPAKPADTAPTDELEAFAKENQLDAAGLARLAEIIAKRIPQGQLSAEEKQQLTELTAYKAKKDAEETRAAEDQEVLATAPTVKTQLEIHDDAELATVMKEIVKLSHTAEFHDKEVDYIVWKNKDALAKLVSPKKPSFESGGHQGDAPAADEPDFSSGKGITPGMAEKATMEKQGSALVIRKGK
jgi:colicin import membrane protein